jgi:hypothetical protein
VPDLLEPRSFALLARRPTVLVRPPPLVQERRAVGLKPVVATLAAWRAADRALAMLAPDDAGRADAIRAVDQSRDAYHEAEAAVSQRARRP